MSVLPACTAIQWRDDRGIDHHAGLVALQTIEQSRGVTAERVSFGVDMRLSGEDPGITIGFKRTLASKPDVVTITPPDDMGNAVAAHLAHPGDLTPRARSPWRLFFGREEISRDTTLLETAHWGFEWTFGRARPGFRVGYSSSRHIVGPALQEGIVQVEVRDPAEPAHRQLTLWRLAAEDAQPRARGE